MAHAPVPVALEATRIQVQPAKAAPAPAKKRSWIPWVIVLLVIAILLGYIAWRRLPPKEPQGWQPFYYRAPSST